MVELVGRSNLYGVHKTWNFHKQTKYEVLRKHLWPPLPTKLSQCSAKRKYVFMLPQLAGDRGEPTVL